VFAGRLLSQAMVEAGKYVSLRYAYGAEVMGTPVHSELVLSDEPILCPFFREAQVTVVLHPRAFPEALLGVGVQGLLVVDSAVALKGVPAGTRVEVRPFVAATTKGRPGDPGRLAPISALGFLAKTRLFPSRTPLARSELRSCFPRKPRSPRDRLQLLNSYEPVQTGLPFILPWIR